MTWTEEECRWAILAAYASWRTRQGRVPDLGAMLAGLGLAPTSWLTIPGARARAAEPRHGSEDPLGAPRAALLRTRCAGA